MRRFTFTPPEPRIAGYPDKMTVTISKFMSDPKRSTRELASDDVPVERLRAAFGDANPNLPEHRGWAFQAIVDITDLPDWIEEGGDTGHRSSVGSDGVSRPMKLVPVTEVE